MVDSHLSQSKETFQYSFGENFSAFKKESKDTLTSPINNISPKDNAQKSMFRDMKGVVNENKELKQSIAHMESKLQSKDHEIMRLRCQLETKGSLDGTIFEKKRPALTVRCTNRSPASGEHNEGRLSKNFRPSDLKKDKSFGEDENKILLREIEKLKEKLKASEEEKRTLKREVNKSYERNSSRLSVVEDERNELSKHNDSLRLEIERLSEEVSILSEERYDMKKKYEDLKSCYDTLETLTSNKFSDYSIESTPHSDTFQSIKDIPSSKLFGKNGKSIGEDSLSSIRTNSELSPAECRKLLGEIMDVYKIKNPMHIMASIHKTEKVIQAIPRLRKMITDISAIVLPKADRKKDIDQVDLLIPSIKKCFAELEELEAMRGLRNKLMDMLEIGKDCPNFEILKKVDNLICAQYSDLKSQRSSRDTSDRMLFDSFAKIFGMKPDVNNFKQIHAQLEDLKHFTNLMKQKSGLNFSLKSETCLKYLLKLMENSKRDREAADIALKLQKTLNCKLETVNTRVEELIEEKYKYNPFNYEGRI